MHTSTKAIKKCQCIPSIKNVLALYCVIKFIGILIELLEISNNYFITSLKQ